MLLVKVSSPTLAGNPPPPPPLPPSLPQQAMKKTESGKHGTIVA